MPNAVDDDDFLVKRVKNSVNAVHHLAKIDANLFCFGCEAMPCGVGRERLNLQPDAANET